MTEAEWLSSDTTALLKRLGKRANERQLRLFACACCRRAPWLASTDQFNEHLRLVEQYADGELDESDRERTEKSCSAIWDSYYRTDRVRSCLWSHLHFASKKELIHRPWTWGETVAAAFGYAADLELAVATQTEPAKRMFQEAKQAEREQQAPLVRDIFGKSFYKKARIESRWRTFTAVALAQGMYESRDFSAMPILADALQDAGCDNEEILAHCRDEKQPHVRGCWVVDLVLGKA